MKVEIRFINKHDSMLRAPSELDDLSPSCHRARRAVGVGDCNDLCGWRDGSKQALKWELQVVIGLNCNYARIGSRGVDLVHSVGRDWKKQLIARFQKCLEQHVNRFIHAIGKRHLCGFETEVPCHNCFYRLALGVTGKISS